MPAFLRTARPLAVAAAVSVLLAACGDDDPAGPAFSEETANQVANVAEDVVSPIESTAEVQANMSLAWGALLGFGSSAVSPMQPFEGLAALRGGFAARPLAVPSAPSAPSGVLIPEEVEGTTFVWSFDAQGYVASDVTGAPANGVRFVYYAVDPVSELPAEPLNELGHIDLIDASTDAKARLEIVAIRDQGDVTLADYFVEGGVTGNLAQTTITIDSEGFFSDGSDRLDFDMRQVVTGTENVTTSSFTAELEANGGSISVSSEETLEGEDDFESEASFRIEGDGNVAIFEYTTTGTLESQTIDGGLRFNSRDVVVVSGDAYEPEFTRPDGSALTSVEIDALARMWIAAGTTMLFVFQTLFPFLFLLAFAGV